MESRLSAKHYLSEQVFTEEQTRLFRHLWIYACMRSALDEDQAFVTRDIGGISVLIQNHEGQLRAFENSCPHRLMPIQTEEFGQGRMICPYHGWVFDAQGKVKTIPKENSLYGYEPQERERLCLKEFSLHQIGNLVFVNLNENPIDIREQFSPELMVQLEQISEHFGSLSVHADIPTRYNWKLNFENVLDPNHIPYVHPKSFQPLVKSEKVTEDAEVRPEACCEPETGATLSAQSFHTTTRMEITPWPWHEKVERYGAEGTYHNFFLFPNVNFISVGGLVFLVQQFMPQSAGQTQVRFTLCLAREKGRLPALAAILQGHLKGEIDVLMEDVGYLEALQAGLHPGSARVQHGRYEARLMAFADAYLKLMGASVS